MCVHRMRRMHWFIARKILFWNIQTLFLKCYREVNLLQLYWNITKAVSNLLLGCISDVQLIGTQKFRQETTSYMLGFRERTQKQFIYLRYGSVVIVLKHLFPLTFECFRGRMSEAFLFLAWVIRALPTSQSQCRLS